MGINIIKFLCFRYIFIIDLVLILIRKLFNENFIVFISDNIFCRLFCFTFLFFNTSKFFIYKMVQTRKLKFKIYFNSFSKINLTLIFFQYICLDILTNLINYSRRKLFKRKNRSFKCIYIE